MPIDTSILGSYRPPQAENLFNTLTQFEAIRSAQQQRQLNALQLQKAQREQEQEQATNALLGEPGMFDPETGEINYGAIMQAAPRYGLGGQVPKYAEMQLKQKKASREAQEAQFKASQEQDKAINARLEQFRNMHAQVTSREGLLALHNAAHTDPTVGPFLKRLGVDPAEGEAKIKALPDEEVPAFAAQSAQSLESLTKSRVDSAAISDAKKYADQAFGPPVRDKSAVGQPTPLGQGRDVAANEVQFGQAPVDPVAYALTMAERLDGTGRSDLAKNYRDEAKFAFERQTAGLTSDLKEYEYARKFDKFTGTFEQWQKRIKPLSAASTTVKLPPSQTAEQTQRGGFLMDTFKTISQRADQARRTIARVDIAKSVLDRGFRTGWGAEAQASAASVLSALGLSKDAEKYAANAQSFLAMARETVQEKMLAQKGPQTDNDAKRLDQTAASLTNEREANEFILAVTTALANRDIAERKFYADWYRKNKTYDGAEDAWVEGPASKSIFDDPALKKYAPATGGKAPAAPTAGGQRKPLGDIFK
jgi:hypothetical protein